MWLTDRPFYSLGFEVGAKNWYISRVQHRLNNFGPFAKVLAVDGQTWHSLQSDMHDRSLCGVSTNLFLDESAGPQATFPWMNSVYFFWWFSALWWRNVHVLEPIDEYMNYWDHEGWNTPKWSLNRWPSLKVHHWATILRFLIFHFCMTQLKL